MMAKEQSVLDIYIDEVNQHVKRYELDLYRKDGWIVFDFDWCVYRFTEPLFEIISHRFKLNQNQPEQLADPMNEFEPDYL